MPSIRWSAVLNNPTTSLSIVLRSSFLSTKEILQRLFRPFESRTLHLRNALARIWIGTIFATNSSIFYSEGDASGVATIDDANVQGYLVSSTGEKDNIRLRDADTVVLFAHGGGMIIGHPLQYLTDYRRWAHKAKGSGKRVVFVAVKYPLSTEAKWPAQRTAVVDAYQWLLRQLPATKIVMAGDSAGGNLIALTLLHLRDGATSVPMPAGAVLMSPWLDMTARETQDSPNWWNDFMFNLKEIAPMMNDALRPVDLPRDTAEVNAVLAKDVGGLPRQLVLYSSTEQLARDSERWIERSRGAGVDVVAAEFPGEMHTFAVGWPMAGSSTRAAADEVFLRFLVQQTTTN